VTHSQESQGPCTCGMMPIENHDEELLLVSLTDLGQKAGHAFRVHLLGRHEIKTTIPGADRGILVTELPNQGQVDNRAMRSRSPARSGIAHSPKAGLILKHQPYRQLTLVFQAGGIHRFGEFFLNSSCMAGSLFGCFVSGCTLRHPWRANNRYVVEMGASCLNPSTKAA